MAARQYKSCITLCYALPEGSHFEYERYEYDVADIQIALQKALKESEEIHGKYRPCLEMHATVMDRKS